MKKVCLSLMILTVLLISHAPVSATDYGREWINLPTDTQFWYVAGFVEGYFHSYLVYGFRPAPISQKEKDTDKPRRERIIHILGLEYAHIADTMTRFYRDPANGAIEHGIMCSIVIDKLTGDTQRDMEKKLEEARRSLPESPEPGQ